MLMNLINQCQLTLDVQTMSQVTRCEERGRVKCHQYWPDEGSKTYGDIEVTNMHVMELSDYVLRSFMVKQAGERAERMVNHYHYIAWPDHGVPTSKTSILNFVRKSSGSNPPNSGPIVSNI